MDIVSYLLELIETQKNIGINALGTLYKKKIPGRYDSETHSFLPPKYEITFTNEIKEDQNLANFISQKRSISIESANYYINEFAENIQAQLADHQQADFLPIGELKLINDEIILESSKTIAVDRAFYGLPSVTNFEAKLEEAHSIEHDLTEQKQLVQENTDSDEQTPNVSDEESSALKEDANPEEQFNDEKIGEDLNTSPVSELDDQPVYDEITELNHIQELNETEERVDLETESFEDELEEPNRIPEEALETTELVPEPNTISDPSWRPPVLNRFEYDDEEEPSSKNRWVRVALKAFFTLLVTFVAIGIFIYIVYPNLYYTIKEKIVAPSEIQSQPIETPDTSKNQKIDSPKSDTANKNVVIENIPKDTIAKPTIAVNNVTKTQPVRNTITYEIIGSAMKTQKKVDEVISNFARRGITAKKMETMPGRLIKISLGTFTDYKLAKKFQDSLKIKLKNPDIYIQTIKPKN